MFIIDKIIDLNNLLFFPCFVFKNTQQQQQQQQQQQFFKRYFGKYRVGSNLIPDDIDGISSCHIWEQLINDPNILLYESEIDHGRAYRKCRPMLLCLLNPLVLLHTIVTGSIVQFCLCDELYCWIQKEYTTRTYIRIYSNRIEYNTPHVRFPFGCCGCGSWTSDNIIVHPFDRGTFGFSIVKFGTLSSLCCYWPTYGTVVGRHRCQCNGSLWNRFCTNCSTWWCDEWICQLLCCTYKYDGIANADEFQFIASIILQCYYENRIITPDDITKCLSYWYNTISERSNPIQRKRPVCCEPYYVPTCTCTKIYKHVHPYRPIPYGDDDNDDDNDDANDIIISTNDENIISNKNDNNTCTKKMNGRSTTTTKIKKRFEITDQLRDVYNTYEIERVQQNNKYEQYYGPVHYSTLCRGFGCRRCFGRKGCCFCTEGCDTCWYEHYNNNCSSSRSGSSSSNNNNHIAPPITCDHDIDDEWDASTILMHVLGPPPKNVIIERWRYDPESNTNYLDIYPTPLQPLATTPVAVNTVPQEDM
jgi:hypothetical protein